MIPALILTWVGLLAISWLGWQLLHQNGRLLLRVEDLEKRLDGLEYGEGEESAGLAIGIEAPAFELSGLAGERKSLAHYQGQPVLLIFFNPACGFCRELLQRLAAMQWARTEGQPSEVALLIVTVGDAEENRRLFDKHQVNCPVLLQEKMEVAAAYQANGTPGGYLIDSEGKIASKLHMGAEALLPLLERRAEDEKRAAAGDNDRRASRFSNRSLAHSQIKRDGLKAGTVAPEFSLPRLDGRGELALSSLRGRRVLLVFSSPGCAPCNTLAPELEKFHRAHPELEMVLISKGDPKENRAKVKEHNLTFTVVLQRQWEISRQYAMFATPAAYVIDEVGVIVRDLAVGADAILDLLTQSEPWSRDGQDKLVPA